MSQSYKSLGFSFVVRVKLSRDYGSCIRNGLFFRNTGRERTKVISVQTKE